MKSKEKERGLCLQFLTLKNLYFLLFNVSVRYSVAHPKIPLIKYVKGFPSKMYRLSTHLKYTKKYLFECQLKMDINSTHNGKALVACLARYSIVVNVSNVYA